VIVIISWWDADPILCVLRWLQTVSLPRVELEKSSDQQSLHTNFAPIDAQSLALARAMDDILLLVSNVTDLTPWAVVAKRTAEVDSKPEF